MKNILWEVCLIGLTLTVFTLINISTKPIKHKTDLLLCAWLGVLNVPLIHAVMGELSFSFDSFYMYTNPTLNLLHGPILYLYVRMLISEKNHIRIVESLHFLPFILFYLVFINIPHLNEMTPLPEHSVVDVASIENKGISYFLRAIFIHFGFINGFIFLVYSILTLYLLSKHQHKIVEVFSQKTSQIGLRWISSLPLMFAVAVIVNVINEKVLLKGQQFDALTLHMLSFLSIIILLCFFGVKQKPVFYERLSLPKEKLREEDETEVRLIESSKDSMKMHESDSIKNDALTSKVINKMQLYMENEKPYLDPDFSVYMLAESINVPRRVLSQVLSRGLSKNFYQYVNEFRIDEVKALLISPDESTSTILDIAYRSGFQSKSSFNSLFKQHCHVTPSKFREINS